MSAYDPLAMWYDSLTEDVPYEAFADFYERLLMRGEGPCSSILDLCCGTGTLTCMLARRGYDMTGVDSSPEMLARAQQKAEELDPGIRPLFLCQEASELDLYGTVQGALCSLDGMNYIPPDELGEVFRRLHLFIEPGGRFAFDMHLPEHLRELDGGVFVDETDEVFCMWRAQFDEDENALVYGMDIFRREGELWRRGEEEHIEYAHEPDGICALLREAGFEGIELTDSGPLGEMGRIFIACSNTGHTF